VLHPVGSAEPVGVTYAKHIIGTPKIYTTTGLGPRKNRELAGVDDLVVNMQTVLKLRQNLLPSISGTQQNE